ncbi:MAG: lysine--tRNA ligase [Opitutaceae bacterium]|jgi:lysyl-tRNA synthetase class 2|nr:lysine--tRNA ligase [Opitutaceae bacterium]
MSDIPTAISHDQNAVRRQKLADLRAAGADPFRANCEQSHFSGDAIKSYVEGQDNAVRVSVAGRLVTIRIQGGSGFVKIIDQQGQIQLYVKRDLLGADAYTAFKKLDFGDFIGVTGTLFKTKAGEITVRVESYTLVSKALRPLPEKWHGLADAEQIYRQRYLDLIVNADSRRRLMTRSRIVSYIRRFLEERKFIEVETPMLQTVAGGAAARPFETHLNALNIDFVLRISLELYLKRMLVGGFDRVFELGRNFRNEGMDRKHNPEFTMLEVYQAYSDFRGMMTLVRDLFQGICRDVLGSMTVSARDKDGNAHDINFDGEWREVRYKDLLVQHTGDADWFSRAKDEKIAWCKGAGLFVDPAWEDFEITNEIFSKRIEHTLIQPTFVTHLPRELCPLAKINREDPGVIDVFELVIGGMEVAPAYSEQNDPDVQRAMFEAQAGAEQQKVDTDFLLALEHGMPPAGGMGIGIDRLCILLTAADGIRDVILYPQLRPPAAPADAKG